jgi:hypothetical protein
VAHRDFCRKPLARWRYPADSRDWRACAKCHEAIEAEDQVEPKARCASFPNATLKRHFFMERFDLWG